MNNLQISARFNIHEGKVDEFKKLAQECLAIVKEKEPDAIQYDFFFSADQSECVVRETYADSDALLVHLGNISDVFPKILQISDLFVEIYGTPSEQLAQAITGINKKVYSYYQGVVPAAVLV